MVAILLLIREGLFMASQKKEKSMPFAKQSFEEFHEEEQASAGQVEEVDFDEMSQRHAAHKEAVYGKRKEEYKRKRELARGFVEMGAEHIFKRVQPFELHGSDQMLKANYSQINFRVAPEKRDWASTYMDEMLNSIDKEILQEGFSKLGGRGKKSKGSDFVLNAFMDLFIVLQEDQEKLELPESYHDWLESLRGYLKVRRKHMNFKSPSGRSDNEELL
jgi:hypothetical protein